LYALREGDGVSTVYVCVNLQLLLVLVVVELLLLLILLFAVVAFCGL